MSNQCLECPQEETPQVIPNCSTTTFKVTPVACEGTVTALEQPDYVYCCTPIGIDKVNFKVCADCPCPFIGVKIDSLPTNGKLYLCNVEVEEDDILTEQTNGQLIYEKNPDYVGEDTFTVVVLTACGESAPITITISCQDVECSTPAPCTTC